MCGAESRCTGQCPGCARRAPDVCSRTPDDCAARCKHAHKTDKRTHRVRSTRWMRRARGHSRALQARDAPTERDTTDDQTDEHRTRQGKQRKRQDGRSVAGDCVVVRRWRRQTVYAMNLHGGTAHTHRTLHTHARTLFARTRPTSTRPTSAPTQTRGKREADGSVESRMCGAESRMCDAQSGCAAQSSEGAVQTPGCAAQSRGCAAQTPRCADRVPGVQRNAPDVQGRAPDVRHRVPDVRTESRVYSA